MRHLNFNFECSTQQNLGLEPIKSKQTNKQTSSWNVLVTGIIWAEVGHLFANSHVYSVFDIRREFSLGQTKAKKKKKSIVECEDMYTCDH